VLVQCKKEGGGGGGGGVLNIHSQRIKIPVDSQVIDPRRYMKGNDSLT